MSVEIAGAQLAQSLRGRQVRLLLAYLVLNRGRHVGRDELIDVLWPDQAPRSEDASLRTLLSRLRSAIGPSNVAGRDELMLELPDPVWIDVEAAGAEIQRAQDALDHGDARGAWALAQVPLNISARGLLPGAQARWLEARRRELDEIRLQALEVIGRAGLELGGTQLASVERAARTLIEAEPYRESGYGLLMEALAGRGNIAEGLRVFERLRTLLRDELGTAPSRETLAIHQRLLHPHAWKAAASESESEQPRLELPAELRGRAELEMVGREREMEQLEALWAAVAGSRPVDESEPASGSGRIVLLTGDPGVGKTRLAAELAVRVHAAGGLVLAGRAPEETLVPYQPFLEALRHYVLGAPLPELRANAREYGPELARLVPELRRRAPDIPSPPEGDPETDRYRLFEAVVGLLTAISRSVPILLVLDDLQWADRPTLLLLRHLTRAADPARMLILGAYRAAEAQADDLGDALAELDRERLVTRLEVPGLSDDETAEVIRVRTGESPSRSFAQALHRVTEGNPFFVGQIMRHLREAGVPPSAATPGDLRRFGLPEGVKQVIGRRLGRLGENALECLRVAAVIGRDFDAAQLEAIVALGEDEFLTALDEALSPRLVAEVPGRPGHYSFRHALIRETLYEGMSAPRRARIHRRVGEALEARGGESQLAALALHFTRAAGAGDAEKAITYAQRAGEQATAMLAHEEAAEHYARALEVLERFEPDATGRRCELLLLLGEARVRSGERSLAAPALREAAALAEKLGDADRVARAAIGASRGYVQQPGVVETDLIAMLRRALEMSEGERTAVRVVLLSRLCGALYYSPERDQMRALSEEATEIAHELGDPEALACACAARRRALWAPAKLPARLATATDMLTLAREAGNLELELQAHAWLAVDLLEQGDRDAVDAQIDAFIEGADQMRQPAYTWHAIVWRGMRALLEGRLEEADRIASAALAAGMPAEAVTAPQYYAIQLLAIRREQGRMAELEQAARQMVASSPERPAWRAGLATLLWEAGKLEEARRELELLAAHDFEDVPRDGDWMTAIALASDVCAALGDGDRAALLYEQLQPYADANVVIGLAAVCYGSAARFLGRLAATIGREADAAEHFERALRANAALRAPVCLAHTQLDYASLLGSGPRAAELAEAAARTAAELDLPLVASRARALRA